MSEREDKGPWFADGLRFGCTRCGNCCVGAGTVRVSDVEIRELARTMDLTEDEFRVLYTRRLRGGAVSLRETRSKACVFYSAATGCTVYAARPRQCRTWPFWGGVVHSQERWDEEGRDCPGMNAGPLHEAATISESVADDGTSGRLP